jgi:hypothetical protein
VDRVATDVVVVATEHRWKLVAYKVANGTLNEVWNCQADRGKLWIVQNRWLVAKTNSITVMDFGKYVVA